MQTITEYLSANHRHCDDMFAEAEAAAAAGDLDAALAGFTAFHLGMERHLSKEENIMFPAFEHAMGSTMGPTSVMRMEHEQMRELFAEMQAALDAKDTSAYAGLAETLLVLMQQHNFKEEQMLYQMADRNLDDIEGIIRQMEALP